MGYSVISFSIFLSMSKVISWNWKSSVNLQEMTLDMLKNIEKLITE
jgi:hypothetical protein